MISFALLFDCDIMRKHKKKMYKKILTTFPVAVADIIMFESSPPLMINELFVELVTHSTPAVCSLENLSRKCIYHCDWVDGVQSLIHPYQKCSLLISRKPFPFARYSFFFRIFLSLFFFTKMKISFARD